MRSILFLLLFFCLSCSSSGGDESGGEESRDGGLSLVSLCGVSINNELVNPVTDAELVDVEAIGADTVIITRRSGSEAGNRQLIKLHSITSDGVSTFRVLNGISLLTERVRAGAYFIAVGSDCPVTTQGGGQGVLGQLFSLTGENLSELMLQQGAAVPTTDICGGDVLAACYDTVGLISRPPTDIELDLQAVNFASQCGAVKEGVLQNPVLQAEAVTVQALSSDTVIITRTLGIEAGNAQLVKLHGVASSGVSASAINLGKNFIESNMSGGGFALIADQNCPVVVEGGGTGVLGQLYSASGVSINEGVIAQGSGVPTTDACGGSLLRACYDSIEVDVPEDDGPPSGPPSGNVIDNFLWKPKSERDGNLVVLVNLVGVRIVATGARTETLRDFGPSNGRGTTARSSSSGCAFGNNVKVEFFDSSGARIFLANGASSITVPQGCNRLEKRF